MASVRGRQNRALIVMLVVSALLASAAIPIYFMMGRPSVRARLVTVPSEAMANTLLVGDILTVEPLDSRESPGFGEIVVLKPPPKALFPGQKGSGIEFVKRVIGCPGDLVEIRRGELVRNGEILREPYVSTKSYYDFKLVKYDGDYWPLAYNDTSVNTDYVVEDYQVDPEDAEFMKELLSLKAEKIAPGFYLVMGDNRANSSDGRAWGLVPRENLKGKVVNIAR